MKKLSAAVLAAAAMGMLFTGSAHAETNPRCGSVTQIGSTGYMKSGGTTIASVKQFKGCNKNWAYVYVWDSWRANHRNYHIRAGIWTRTSDGAVDYNGNDSGAQELWSSGANTLGVCTTATGEVFGSGFSYSGHSDERC
ncbi:hypothetical protein ABZX92_15090 [Lentzea sp. NPDC006480]|uniref:hypothetical protein n=1 Tax=Lentzea sp. NPDC006480 TaxID=3157176 RepID=UPI0033A0DA88